jgi:putative ABC transport system permease protein
MRRLGSSLVSSWSIIVTLGLGIGLAAATGVVARAVAFDGLPIRDADRVLMLWGVDRAGSFSHLPLRPADVASLTERMRGVADVAPADYNGATVWPFHSPSGSGAPLRLRGTLAGGRYFDVLGAVPVLGRALRAEDDVIGAERVMVLSHAAWRRHFGGDLRVIGRSLKSVIFGATYTIVGVMPPGLDVPRGVEFWTAFTPSAAVGGSLERSPWAVDVLARIAPGGTSGRVEEVLTSFYASLADKGQSQYAGARATSRTVAALVTGDVRAAFGVLAAAAALVLVVTCGNVGGLLLLQASGRRRELALRAALGASRATLLRTLAARHAVLALAGGAVGLLVAIFAVSTFARMAPRELPRVEDLAVDWRLFAALTVVTALVVLVVGVGSALSATRVSPAAVLGGAPLGAGGTPRDVRARRLLVGGQVALALVVLSAASLVGRSLANLTTLDLGIAAPDRLVFVELIPSAGWDDAPGATVDPASRRARWDALQDEILTRVAAIPGVVGVAPVVHEAYAGSAGWDARLEAVGASANDSTRRPYLNMEITNEDYLRVTGGTLVRGRWITRGDRDGSDRIIVLSDGAARSLFPSEDPIGRRVRLWGDVTATVVGLVRDTRFRDHREARASFYLPHRQFDGAAPFLAVRTDADPAGVVMAIRQVMSGLAPGIVVQDHGTLQTRLAEPLARPRLLAAVLGGFATVVVLLALAGVYTIVAGSVAARRREFGVRSALGATPQRLLALVMGEGGRIAALGASVGVLLSLWGGRLLESLLYGVVPTDPVTLGVSTVAVLLLCALAVAPSAWRAAVVDPARELRGE